MNSLTPSISRGKRNSRSSTTTHYTTILLAVHFFTSATGTVTLVQATCVQGTSWIPAVTTTQTWCLTCVCLFSNLSICKASFLGGCGTAVTIPGVTLPSVVTVPPVTVPPVSVPPVTVPTNVTVAPVTPLPTIVPVIPGPGPGVVVIPPVTAPPGRR